MTDSFITKDGRRLRRGYTTGIVEPMSDRAVVETVRAELSLRRAAGREAVLLVPGNIGAEFAKAALGLDPTEAVTVSNFVGEALSLTDEMSFRGGLFCVILPQSCGNVGIAAIVYIVNYLCLF